MHSSTRKQLRSLILPRGYFIWAFVVAFAGACVYSFFPGTIRPEDSLVITMLFGLGLPVGLSLGRFLDRCFWNEIRKVPKDVEFSRADIEQLLIVMQTAFPRSYPVLRNSLRGCVVMQTLGILVALPLAVCCGIVLVGGAYTGIQQSFITGTETGLVFFSLAMCGTLLLAVLTCGLAFCCGRYMDSRLRNLSAERRLGVRIKHNANVIMVRQELRKSELPHLHPASA